MTKKFSLKSFRRSLRQSQRENKLVEERAKTFKNDANQVTTPKEIDKDLT